MDIYLKHPLVLNILCANSESFVKTAWMHRLAWSFTVCLCDKDPFTYGLAHSCTVFTFYLFQYRGMGDLPDRKQLLYLLWYGEIVVLPTTTQTLCSKHSWWVALALIRSLYTINQKLNWSIFHRLFWAASSEFGTYRLCKQRRFRRACTSTQSHQNLRCSLIQAVNQEEPSDRKPDPWPLWMAGHAQLKFVMTECSKTQIRLTGLIFMSPKK